MRDFITRRREGLLDLARALEAWQDVAGCRTAGWTPDGAFTSEEDAATVRVEEAVQRYVAAVRPDDAPGRIPAPAGA